jgi:hypothetical protein
VSTGYAYLPSDFADLPADPISAAQTVASLSVTLSRGAAPVGITLADDRLAADLRIGARAFAPGDAARPVWSLVDVARGARLTAVALSADGVDAPPCTVLVSGLPLKPGQSYSLSLPVEDAALLAGGFAAGTRLMTREGKTPVAEIRPGTLVWTDAAGFQPVIWTSARSLPGRGLAAPVRLRRGSFGLTEDLLLAGSQHFRVIGPEGPVLVPAAAAVRAGRAVREFGASVSWHQILLADHALVQAHGLAVESLWPPALLRLGRPADWPADLPLPTAPVLPRLSEEEGARLLA